MGNGEWGMGEAIGGGEGGGKECWTGVSSF